MKLEKFNELSDAFNKLPGVGKKSANRFAYFISIENKFMGLKLASLIEEAVKFIKPCKKCGGISENEICDICNDESRDKNLLSIVQSPRDILLFENSKIFNGIYFVLENISEDNIQKLRQNIIDSRVKEIIFALSPGINSDAIVLFIEDKLKDLELKFTKIAQGVPTGINLENVDIFSLQKAFDSRTKI